MRREEREGGRGRTEEGEAVRERQWGPREFSFTSQLEGRVIPHINFIQLQSVATCFSRFLFSSQLSYFQSVHLCK